MKNIVDLNNIRPYGDHLNDGMVQLSFTLPVPHNKEGKKAAKMIAQKMGINDVDIVYAEKLLEGFTFFIIYGKCSHSVNYNLIEVNDADVDILTQKEIEKIVQDKIKRDIVIVGASTGTDTHTVGIDSILNMKGYDGHYGLERFRGFKTFNLGGQVPNEKLLLKAIEVNADAILVSQTVTQQRLHIQNLTQFIDMVEAEGLREKFILIIGGPRITNELAKELGYDAGYSKGTFSNHVAIFVIDQLLHKLEL